MAVMKPQKALEVNGQEIYPLTHADQVIMPDGGRMSTNWFLHTTQVTNGITVDIFRIGALVLLMWNGIPVTQIPAGSWYNLAMDLPKRDSSTAQPSINCLTTPGKYFYNVILSTTNLQIRPITTDIPTTDAVRGQLMYIAAISEETT